MPKQPVLSPARELELLALFPHQSDADLARHFGITVRQAHHIGAKNGLHKTAATRSASRRNRIAEGPALTVQVENLVAASGVFGASRASLEAQLPKVSPSGVSSALNKLTASDRLHRAGGKGHSRWFKSAADAQSHNARLKAARNPVCAPAPKALATVYIAPTPGPAQQSGAMRITPETKFTKGPPVPGPEGRWHTNAQPVFSGAGRIGCYDDTASSWVSAITERRA